MRSWILLTALVLGAPAGAQGFITPTQFGWDRGDPGSTYYAWEDFGSATAPNPPDEAATPASVDGVSASLIETTGTAFRTSTGNIYSITTVVEFEVTVPAEVASGDTTTVLLQTRTQGREIDPASVLAGGLPPVEVVELFRFQLGPDDIFGGFLIDTAYRFEVPSGNPIVVVFAASDTSMSLDRVSVDTLTTASCPADVNGDGAVLPNDFSAWIMAFNTLDPGADQNGDGLVLPNDFSAWIANFNGGC